MKRKDSEQDYDGFNTPFDRWLRDNEPTSPEYPFDLESSLAGFQKKMKAEKEARNARLKNGIIQKFVTVGIVLLSVGVFNMTDVGSDGFWMVEVEDGTTMGRVVENEFRGGGFNVLERETDQKIRAINEQFSGGEGEVVGVDGWKIKGKTYWNVLREFSVGGETRVITSFSENPKTNISQDFGVFLEEHWGDLKNNIKSGTILPSAEQVTKDIDGTIFGVSTWILDTPDGQILYFSGYPIR